MKDIDAAFMEKRDAVIRPWKNVYSDCTNYKKGKIDMNKEKKVNIVELEEFNKLYPVNSEVTMSPIPEGHVAKLATFHLANR